ncbi:MAG: hypothetical protein R2867_22755 [Caldilineaceae bacterium]
MDLIHRRNTSANLTQHNVLDLLHVNLWTEAAGAASGAAGTQAANSVPPIMAPAATPMVFNMVRRLSLRCIAIRFALLLKWDRCSHPELCTMKATSLVRALATAVM